MHLKLKLSGKLPRSLSKEISWDKFFVAVVDGDTNVIREYDSEDTDFGIYNEGEKVTLLSGQEEFYNPRKIQQLRSKCVDIQNDYLMQVFFMSMLAPEFVSIFWIKTYHRGGNKRCRDVIT